MQIIVFEFIGGPNDGKVLRGRLGEPCDAARYYLSSNRGAVGQRFKMGSRYAIETLSKQPPSSAEPLSFQRHYYIVTDRMEDGHTVRVRAEYSPESAAADSSSPEDS